MTQPATAPRPPVRSASTVKVKAALRKAIRRNASEPEIDFLNITAMLDMMTIILVFLLKNMTTSNAAPSQGDDLKLPKSVMLGQPKEEGVTVMISKTQILVGDDPRPVIQLPGREALAQSGVNAEFKRNGPKRSLHRAARQLTAVGARARQASAPLEGARRQERGGHHCRRGHSVSANPRSALYTWAIGVRPLSPDGALGLGREIALGAARGLIASP